MLRALRTDRSTRSDFDLAWFSPPSSDRLRNFSLHGLYIFKFSVAFFRPTLPFSGLSLVGMALDLLN